ncbi:glycosyl hydrolase 115 family protein [Aliifodinibius sp. S!AR15-10]|uniref:glycosyl hydrolase 115 family protein n=1 Tax=Aliifodinibius sp. S!AR15-10 TaxID=2950437 RepID=UPI00286FC305|nr:glycosyl hydrolase 115 family protein [Aliifodinibius sp. S!AR15-10]
MAILGCHQALAQFTITDQDGAISIVHDIEHSALDSIAAHLLARDIEAVTGQRPEVFTDLHEVGGNVIILGDVSSDLISRHVDTSRLAGRWEMYGRVFRDGPTAGIDQAMFIVGSDPRGMAYGVFELSREIGVSPWYWWADVPVEQKNTLSVSAQDTFSTSPSVKYRGVFLNDEGWGLEPWASNTFEPSVGNMGPKTYAKIFELLLRLKADMVWPAMHPNTEPFFQVPGNAETAEKWEIVVGTSHAEPMLRNNVGEWDHEERGDFNYQTNASSVYEYWQERVKESKDVNAIYTVGMRGVHDSGMEGFDSMDEKVSALEKVISDQRGLLSRYINEDVSEVPQSFTPYKEVLEIYENGLKVPEDITITWPDDNHGYIRRFSDQAEQRRSGGAGVYYHLSYLGAPHPYIWLSPTTPAQVWREMRRAWLQNMNEIWIANVGDIKRREWETEFFMDIAWNIDSWSPENIKSYFETVASRDISEEHGEEISEMMWEYYRLATERKPEFMGFNESQWNGWTPIRDPLYSLWHYGDEVQRRMESYQQLQSRAQKLRDEIPDEARDTYFHLVYYPIAGATAMNEKWLYAYKSREYANQGRAAANTMSDSAFAAYDQIQQLTHHYNHEVAGGKWEHIVDYSPSYEKGSLVFWEPITKRIETEDARGLGVAIEGQPEPLQPTKGSLPGITTRGSNIELNASEAELSGELETGTDSEGTFVRWPEEGSDRTISGLHWDTIPYEIDHPTKAVFEFYLEDEPGGVHTLNMSTYHPDEDSNSWWVTVNDKPVVQADGPVGRIQQLKVDEYVLKPGRNTLTIHPREDGAKLYGIEFVQESQNLSPSYTEMNRLPTFNRYTRQHHFVDIYSRGQETQHWSAKTSAPWIQLSDDEGELSGGSERIWVTVNYDQAPASGDISGHIDITSGEQSYRVAVSAFNQQLYPSSDAFIETNGVISMLAGQYSQNQVGRAASWRPVTGLGRSGSAMLLEPMKGWYVKELSQVHQQSPALEYEIVVTEGGAAEVIVEAVPAFPLNPSQQLRCAISIGDGEPQWINFEMGNPGSQPWIDNVLESRMIGTGQLDLEPGTYRLKLWGTDPSVNVDQITIDFGGLEPSYVGPSSTKIRRGHL